MPSNICSTRRADSVPTYSPSCVLLTDETCDTIKTPCFVKLPSPESSNTMPGSFDRFRFEVTAHTITVLMPDRLNTSS